MERIDITGIPLPDLVLGLYRGTRPLGMGFLHDKPDLSVADVEPMVASDRWFNNRMFFDYVCGRPLKVTLVREGENIYLERADLYDRDAGPGACERVVRSLRAA